MLVLTMRRATGPENALELFADLESSLPPGFVAVIGPAVEFQATRLGLTWDGSGRVPRGIREDVSAAEVIRHEGALFVLTLEQELRLVGEDEVEQGTPQLMLYVAAPRVDPPALAELQAALSTHFVVTFEPYVYRNRRFDEIASDASSTFGEVSIEDVAHARVLVDRTVRTLATAVKASGGLLISDVPKQVPGAKQADVDDAVRSLVDSGLVGSEFVVVCRKSNTQAARAPTRQAIEEMARLGARCGCGRSFADEKVEEALAITDAGREVIDGSRWMSILVREELVTLGVPPDRILVEALVGGDELDCLADISGELTLFELKDKEFSLGEAYSLGAKLGVVRPRHAVVVTSDKVGGDAVEHFKRIAAPRRSGIYDDEGTRPVAYIEGLANLRAGVEELLSGIYTTDFTNGVRGAVEFAALPARYVVTAADFAGTTIESPALSRATPLAKSGGRTRRLGPNRKK